MTHYDKSYFIKRDHLDLHLADTLARLAHERQAHNLLDIGCGSAKLVADLEKRGFVSFGIDHSMEALKLARYNLARRMLRASATHLPYQNQSLDLVTAISVIEHLRPKAGRKFLSEVQRVLKSGGTLFLVTPNFSSPWRLLQGKSWFAYTDPTHKHYFTPRSLSRLLKVSGFTNPVFSFKTTYVPPYNWEFPGIAGKLPSVVKSMLTFLLISTPLWRIRNSFWLAVRKK